MINGHRIPKIIKYSDASAEEAIKDIKEMKRRIAEADSDPSLAFNPNKVNKKKK